MKHFIQHISSEKDMCLAFAYYSPCSGFSHKYFYPCDVFLMKSQILSLVYVWKTAQRHWAYYLFYLCGVQRISVHTFGYDFLIVLRAALQKIENEFAPETSSRYNLVINSSLLVELDVEMLVNKIERPHKLNSQNGFRKTNKIWKGVFGVYLWNTREYQTLDFTEFNYLKIFKV